MIDVGSDFRTALVIEPEMLPRMAVRQQLLQCGIAVVHEAVDGEEGMAWLSRRGIDLVLTTWDPGGISGQKLVDDLRGESRSPRMPVVLLDHGLPQAMVVKAIKAGVVTRLAMPPRIKNVQSVLRDCLEAKKSAEEKRSGDESKPTET